MPSVILAEEQLKNIQKAELDILREVDRICSQYNIRYWLTCGTLLGAVRHKGFIPWDDDMDIAMTRDDLIKFRKVCSAELSDRFFYQCNETDPEYFYLFDKVRLNGTVFREDYVANRKIHHGIYIDIFPMDYVPENAFLRKIQFLNVQFYRVGLMAKYLDVHKRQGLKKLAAKVLRVLYSPFSLGYLYKKATAAEARYNDRMHPYIFDFNDSIRHVKPIDSEWVRHMERHSFEGFDFPIPQDYDKILGIEYGDYMQLPPESERIPKHQLSEFEIKIE